MKVPGQENYRGPEVRHKKQIVEWLRKNPPSGKQNLLMSTDNYFAKKLP